MATDSFRYDDDATLAIDPKKIQLKGFRLAETVQISFETEDSDDKVLLDLLIADIEGEVLPIIIPLFDGPKHEYLPDDVFPLGFNHLYEPYIGYAKAQYLAKCVMVLRIKYDRAYGLTFWLVLQISTRELKYKTSVSKKEALFQELLKLMILG